MNGLAFLLVIVGGAALAGPAWRSLLDESKSVEQYQRCLSVLGDLTRSATNRVGDAGGDLPAGGDSGAWVERMASAGHVRVVPADIAAAARSSQRPSRRSSGPPHATRARNSRSGSERRRTGSLHPGSRAVLVPSPIRLSLPPELDLHAGRPVFGAGDPPSDQAPDAAPSADNASATEHDSRRRPRRPRTGAWHQSKRLAVAAAVSAFAGIAVPAAGEWRADHRSVAQVPATTSTTASTPANPTTTAPAAEPRLVSQSPGDAHYQVADPSITVTITASDPCWIRVLEGDGEVPTWQGVVTAGETRTFELSTPLSIRFGNATAVTFNVNGFPVPVGDGAPTPSTVAFTT